MALKKQIKGIMTVVRIAETWFPFKAKAGIQLFASSAFVGGMNSLAFTNRNVIRGGHEEISTYLRFFSHKFVFAKLANEYWCHLQPYMSVMIPIYIYNFSSSTQSLSSFTKRQYKIFFLFAFCKWFFFLIAYTCTISNPLHNSWTASSRGSTKYLFSLQSINDKYIFLLIAYNPTSFYFLQLFESASNVGWIFHRFGIFFLI